MKVNITLHTIGFVLVLALLTLTLIKTIDAFVSGALLQTIFLSTLCVIYGQIIYALVAPVIDELNE